MQYVDFGRTGLRVSRLGFGGIPVQRIDEPGTRAMLKAAHEADIKLLEQSISNLDSKYAAESGRLSSELERSGSARRWRNWACGMNLSLPPSAVR